jgi:1-acyl-sn-glycerol-3-phosphate acyltransferase
VQLPGSLLARAALRLAGWQLQFDGLPAPQGVLVFYPHTSNWDFPVAMLAKWGIGLPVRFLAKDTLFRWPLFGRWLRHLGGVPVRRHQAEGVVAQMVHALREAREQGRLFWLALAPEGTRSPGEGWRSGFHQAAVQAGVPLALAFVDYPSRRIGVKACLQLCGRIDADMQAIAQHLAGCRGKRPGQAAPIRMLSRAAVRKERP